MHANRWAWFGIAALVGAAALLLGRQHHATDELRAGIARQKAESRERTNLLAEQQRLLAKQLSVAELERLQAERAAIASLQNELDTMKRRATETASRPRRAPSQPVVPVSRVIGPVLTAAALSPGQWRNAGDATPEAAFESALWAAAGGDVDAVAGLLLFDDEARKKAEAVFARLPDTLQKEIGSSVRLIALLAAKEVPLGSAQITRVLPFETEARVRTHLVDATGNGKPATFTLRNEAGHWRFVVPARAVDRYAAMLQTQPAGAAGAR